mgnify:FL=1|jgi:large subunit ribosomal protein L22|tara:strand:- start:3560 stop:3892 length:333 start_codon:yes stop_codon:yes gene_type:complete
MEVSATLKYINVSPQKCRLVIDLIRGDNVSEAIDKLNYSKQKSAAIVKKVLESAIANAENNNGADIDQLWINKIFVNSGPIMKRFKARARGSADRILKRTCHLTINLSDQ